MLAVSGCLVQGFADDFASSIDFLIPNRQRGQKSQDGLLRAVNQQSTLQARIDNRRGGSIQLHANHRAYRADFLDAVHVSSDLLEVRNKSLFNLGGTGQQSLVFDSFDGGHSGGGGQRISAKRGGMHPGPQIAGQLRGRQ